MEAVTTVEKDVEKTELEKALEVINQVKGAKLQEFSQKLDGLCKEYGIVLEQGPITLRFKE